MIDQISLEKFNEIFDKTYNNVLKFVVCKCSNMDDVNDIVQEIYIELYKKLMKANDIQNIDSYILGIAKNKINKHYGLLYKFKMLSLNSHDVKEQEIIENIPSDIDVEDITIKAMDLEIVWKELRKKKLIVQKIFYLYYNLDFTIKEIARELSFGESYIKNCLYRTLKELQKFMRKDGE